MNDEEGNIQMKKQAEELLYLRDQIAELRALLAAIRKLAT